MNTTTTIHQQPPGQCSTPNQQHTIFVRLTIPNLAEFSPAGSRVGMLMMNRLLDAQLRLANLEVTIGASGQLNDSIYVASVSALGPGLETFRETFASVALGACAEIGYYDPREDVLRIVHPVERVTTWPHDEIQQRCDASAKFSGELTSLVEVLLRKLIAPKSTKPQ